MTATTPLPPTPVLETARLILRPLEERDAPAIQRIFPQWEVVRHLHAEVPWPYPDDGAATNTAMSLETRARGEKFYWVITLKGDDDTARGRIDLWPEGGEQQDGNGTQQTLHTPEGMCGLRVPRRDAAHHSTAERPGI